MARHYIEYNLSGVRWWLTFGGALKVNDYYGAETIIRQHSDGTCLYIKHCSHRTYTTVPKEEMLWVILKATEHSD